MENLHLTKKQWYYLGAVLGVCLIYFAFTHFKGSEAPQKTIPYVRTVTVGTQTGSIMMFTRVKYADVMKAILLFRLPAK